MKYIREFAVNSDMLASNLDEEKGGACVFSLQGIFLNKFQILLGKNNCIECNNIYYCIYLIVKKDKANVFIGYLAGINMMHYRT